CVKAATSMRRSSRHGESTRSSTTSRSMSDSGDASWRACDPYNVDQPTAVQPSEVGRGLFGDNARIRRQPFDRSAPRAYLVEREPALAKLRELEQRVLEATECAPA